MPFSCYFNFYFLSYYCYRIIMCYTQVVDIVKIEYKNKSVPLIIVSLDDSFAEQAGLHSRSMLPIQGFKKINISGNQKLSAPLLSLFMLSNVYNFHFCHLYIVFLCFFIPPLWLFKWVRQRLLYNCKLSQ